MRPALSSSTNSRPDRVADDTVVPDCAAGVTGVAVEVVDVIELLLLRVSSVRVTKLRRSTALRLLKIGQPIFAIRSTASYRTRLAHDDLVFWILLEHNELRPVLGRESWGRSSG